MTQIENPEERKPLPLSLLNDYLYCPRRAALKVIDGWRSANAHTVRGDIVHEHADIPGYEVIKGVKLLRALPVWSDRLGLNGKCDVVEQYSDGRILPVEFKLSKRHAWENDDVQLCAQALCLEEMMKTSILQGAVFHADSKRRRDVEFTPELRIKTEETVVRIHDLVRMSNLPQSIYKTACKKCSLFEICLPQAINDKNHVSRLSEALYQVN